MSKKKKKNRLPKYIPFGNTIFGVEEIYAQGAAALDIAAIIAIKNNDTSALIHIGSEWSRMAAALSELNSKPEERIKVGFGFSYEEEVEEDVEDRSISANQDQPGKLRKRGY